MTEIDQGGAEEGVDSPDIEPEPELAKEDEEAAAGEEQAVADGEPTGVDDGDG